MAGFLQKLFDANEREVRRLWRYMDQVNALEPEIAALADTDFRRGLSG